MSQEKNPDFEDGKRPVRASVLHGPKDLRLENRSLFPPSPTQLQIAIRSTGLCGSDLHYYQHYRNGDIQVLEPLTLGHESAGVVVSVGSSIPPSDFQVGDQVALEVGTPCGSCERCTEGRYNVCKDMKFRSSARGFPHAQGTLQERINMEARWCWKIPPSTPLALGAILEPLSVAIHASRRASLRPDSTVLVFGAGAVGMLVAAMARKLGLVRTVVIADIDSGRVDFAVQNRFATQGFTVPRKRGETVEQKLEIARETARLVGELKRDGDGEAIGEVDAVFECTGVESCLQAAIYATRPGGKIMLIGMGTPIQTLPISAAALREVDLVGVFRYADTYSQGVDIISNREPGDPDYGALVTHTFKGLENADKAFDMAGKTVDEDGKLVIKVVLEMEEDTGKGDGKDNGEKRANL